MLRINIERVTRVNKAYTIQAVPIESNRIRFAIELIEYNRMIIEQLEFDCQTNQMVIESYISFS